VKWVKFEGGPNMESLHHEYENIIYDKEGAIVYITLNRPEKMNTVTTEMFTNWGLAISEAERDDDVKVIIFRGAGRCFSAGAPLDKVGYVYGMKEPTPGEKMSKIPMRVKINFDHSLFLEFFRKVLLCKKITIVQMHKYCLGVAFSIAMHADLLIADEECRVGHVEERLGLAGMTLMPVMIARCGLTKALDLCLTGKMISAQQALDWDLINRVVPTESLETEVRELAEGLARYPKDGIAIAKVGRELVYESMGLTRGMMDHAIMHTFQVSRVYEADEYNAFKERRDKGVRGMAHEKHDFYSALDK
jgi:enoyl-CoA hydratase